MKQVRFNPQCSMDVKEFWPGVQIIQSIGQGMDLSYISEEFKEGIEFGPRGRVQTNEYFQTGVKWFFMGGDIIEGPDVIHGIANGHKAAIGIDNFIQGIDFKAAK